VILAIDLSTSTCKIYVFNRDGKIICSNQKNYNSKSPKENWVELDPENAWSVVCANIKNVLQKIDNKKIIGIGVTAQLGIVPVDERGKALAPILTWMDQRAKNQAGKIEQDIGNKNIYRLSGRRVSPELSCPKMMWFQENEPQIYNKTAKFLSLKDYIIARLTGRFVTDPTHASYTLLYNIEKREWDRELINDLGLDLKKLPDVFVSESLIGTVSKEVAALTGLVEGIPVAVGGPDGSIGTLGAGMIKPGRTVNVVGTTDVFFTCTDKAIFDKQMRTVVNCHLLSGLWSIGGPMSMTGGCLEWFLNEFGQPEKEKARRIGCSAFKIFDEEAASFQLGAENLFFYTSLVGDRTPNWNPNIRGSILGLTPNHKKKHLIRAILEGSSFLVKQVIDILEKMDIELKDVIMVGGGSRSYVWQQTRADVTGKTYLVPNIEENATALGTYIIVAVGLGIYHDFYEAIDKLFKVRNICEPDMDRHREYQKKYKKYLDVHNLIDQIYGILNE